MYSIKQIIVSICLVGFWFFFSIVLISDNEKSLGIKILSFLFSFVMLAYFIFSYKELSSIIIAENG